MAAPNNLDRRTLLDIFAKRSPAGDLQIVRAAADCQYAHGCSIPAVHGPNVIFAVRFRVKGDKRLSGAVRILFKARLPVVPAVQSADKAAYRIIS